MIPNSNFCQLHTCKICHMSNIYGENQIIEIYPRNVCIGHRLCCYISLSGKSCNSIVVSETNYCDRHVNNPLPQMKSKSMNRGSFVVNGCCAGITKKGKKCKTKDARGSSFSVWFSKDHESQNILKVEEVIEEDMDDGLNDNIEVPNVEVREAPNGLVPDKSNLNISLQTCAKIYCQSKAFVRHEDLIQSANWFCYPHYMELIASQTKSALYSNTETSESPDSVNNQEHEEEQEILISSTPINEKETAGGF